MLLYQLSNVNHSLIRLDELVLFSKAREFAWQNCRRIPQATELGSVYLVAIVIKNEKSGLTCLFLLLEGGGEVGKNPEDKIKCEQASAKHSEQPVKLFVLPKVDSLHGTRCEHGKTAICDQI